ncbi:MFS transporter [Amycolatopsis alkalitolerans]|uniref:MFS transporter n=1 Tax=Amycolatopsis alkalitolerans TaxID=2547244 RepID=UPI001F3B4B34|nr:MFS transporter [Amycolatopsis alkalitolerans]
MLGRYLAGAALARMGDEASGPALLLLGLTVTGSPVVASALLAGLTASSAVGGPVFGALLDRARRPGRLLAVALAAYAVGLAAVLASVGRLPLPAVPVLAVLAGLFNPAVAGGWTSQLPVGERGPERATALDAMTFSVASLTGPALAALVADRLGAPVAVAAAAGLVVFALPSAWSLPARAAKVRKRHWTAGFRTFVRHRALLRATVTSMISYVGVGMTTVCYPLLGAQRLGGASRGALLLAVLAAAAMAANAVLARRPWRGMPDTLVFASTLVLAASAALSALPGPAVVGGGVRGRDRGRAPADGLVRGAPARGARTTAGAGVHDRGEPQGDRFRRRVRARGPAGRRFTHRLPARGRRGPAGRERGLPGDADQNAIACARRLTSVP